MQRRAAAFSNPTHATSQNPPTPRVSNNLVRSLTWLSHALREATSGTQAELIAEQSARALERSARLQQVAFALSKAVTPPDVANVVLEQGIEALGAAEGFVALLSADEKRLHMVATRGYHADVVNPWRSLPIDAEIPIAETARTGRAFYFASANELAMRYPAAAIATAGAGSHAMATVPLRVGSRVIGTLGFTFPRAHDFHGAEIEFIEVLAQQCAFALDRARLLEAEQTARRQAERANHAKAEFLSVVSHELRTPLNAINGYTELMAMGVHGPLPEPYASYVHRIRGAQEQLLSLINRVLTLTKLEAGAVQYDLDSVSIHESLIAIDPLIRNDIERKQLTYVELVDRDLIAHADSDRVRQILLNVINNAIKFTQPGGRIEVSAQRAARSCRIEVRDTGMGIPTEKLQAIFDPFFQVEHSLTRGTGGLGLGLAISRDLARGMGGDLCARSEVGVGSIFVLELPAR